MLQKQYRLPAHIRLKHSSFFKTPNFSVKVGRNNLDISRFGFIVRKTIDKRATARNRIRRVFRSCIEASLKDVEQGVDMLFLLEKGIIDKNRDWICHEIQTFLTEKKLLK